MLRDGYEEVNWSLLVDPGTRAVTVSPDFYYRLSFVRVHLCGHAYSNDALPLYSC